MSHLQEPSNIHKFLHWLWGLFKTQHWRDAAREFAFKTPPPPIREKYETEVKPRIKSKLPEPKPDF